MVVLVEVRRPCCFRLLLVLHKEREVHGGVTQGSRVNQRGARPSSFEKASMIYACWPLCFALKEVRIPHSGHHFPKRDEKKNQVSRLGATYVKSDVAHPDVYVPPCLSDQACSLAWSDSLSIYSPPCSQFADWLLYAGAVILVAAFSRS